MNALKTICFLAISFSITACSWNSPSEDARSLAKYVGSGVFDMNDKQQNDLNQIVESGLKAHDEIVPINKELFKEVEKSLQSGNLDTEKVSQLIEQKKILEAKLTNKEMLKVKALIGTFTPEQRKKGIEALTKAKENSKTVQYMLGVIK